MDLFGNDRPEKFLLFIWNLNMNLEASETLKAGAKIQYFFTLVRGQELHQFDTLSAEVRSDIP